MRTRKITALLLCWCLLLSLLPLYAVHAAPWENIHQKDNELQTILLPETEVADPLTPMAVATNRIRYIFPDPALANVIAQAFGVQTYSFIGQRDLDRVVGLAADHQGIGNLQGLQYLTALRELSLNGNRIHNLWPLAGLQNLERLLLDNNQIQDLSPLRGHTALQWLWLDHNHVRDLVPLFGLTGLTWLTLWGNQIESVGPLAGLTNLTALWLADNQIQTIAPLQNLLHLDTLSLADNRITDLTPLSGMSRMNLLWLGRQDVTLTQIMRTDPLDKPSPLRAPDGTPITPDAISHNGTFSPPYFRWEGLTTAVGEVTYSFGTYITLAGAADRFFGTVTQPLGATPFADVRRGTWYYDPVTFVFEANLMSGISPARFAPRSQLTRGMTATVLHRMAGAPEQGSASAVFGDVPDGTWFSQAAHWAYNQGIVIGYGCPYTFAPEQPITREQLVTMLYRFANAQGQMTPPPAGFTLAAFPDHLEVGPWATDAMQWAVYHGIITGTTPPRLLPTGHATRSEAAAVFMRMHKTPWSDTYYTQTH